MSTGDLLHLHPSELKFPFELEQQSSCSLQLTNKTNQYIAFKAMTTKPKKYSARPNRGVILPRSDCIVTFTMQAQRSAPLDMECKDKFLFQAVVAPDGATNEDITANMFNKKEKKVVEEIKLRVLYIPANPPSPVLEESNEGLSPLAHLESMNPSSPEVDVQDNIDLALSMISKLTDEKTAALKQSFKLKQELLCVLHLIS